MVHPPALRHPEVAERRPAEPWSFLSCSAGRARSPERVMQDTSPMSAITRRTVGRVLGGIGLILLAIQFVPVDRSNPPTRTPVAWDSPRTERLARAACFDCHSNETVWPAYARVAPLSWLITRHVHEGRRKVNFSEADVDAEECEEEIQEGEMPLRSYTWLHPEARLSAEARRALIDGLNRTFGGGERRERDGR